MGPLVSSPFTKVVIESQKFDFMKKKTHTEISTVDSQNVIIARTADIATIDTLSMFKTRNANLKSLSFM